MVGPYRECAENLEARLDAQDVAAFQAELARRSCRVWVGVLVTLLGTVAIPVSLFMISLPWVTAKPQPQSPRCESHILFTSAGVPVPMTVCR